MYDVNTLPNDKILDWSKLKTSADENINMTEKVKFVLGTVENVVRKRRKCWLPAFSPFHTMVENVVRKCWLPAFSPFHTMFSKGFLYRVVKSQNLVVCYGVTMALSNLNLIAIFAYQIFIIV